MTMVIGWALLVFAAIKLVSLAGSYVLTTLSSHSPWESDTHQQEAGGAPRRRLAKRGLSEGDETMITSSAAGSTESEMVLVPIVSIASKSDV